MGNKYPKQIYASPLEKLRKERGWNQQQAAAHVVNGELKCDFKSFRSWEKGYTYPDTAHLKRLSEVFGVSTDYLLGLSKERNIGNNEISSITGLSETSIEALRFFSASQGDDDVDKEHKKTIDFINRAFSTVFPSVARYKSEPEEHAPLTTIFATMMKYIDAKDVSLAFWEDGKRKTLSGATATLDVDGDSTGYTVSELSRVVLIERVKKTLERMRLKEGSDDGIF